jgi:hypothetical protein
MHKNDPYIMALAMSESNRRKEMRAADQESMEEQPTVVDQEIAQMAPQQMPEDQGIGQLPAGDMDFAGGGIVAFADGGDVERYQSAGLTRPQFVQDIMGMPQAFDDWKQRAREEDARRAEEDRRMAQNRQAMLEARSKTSLSNYLFGSPERDAEGAAEYKKATSLAPAAPAGYDPTENLKKLAQTNAKYVTPALAAPKNAEETALLQRYPMSTKAVPPAAPPAASSTTNNKAAAPSAPPAPSGQTQSSEAGIEALQKKYFDPLNQEIGDLRNARVGLASGIAELANKNLAATKADVEKRGDVYKGREERLTKQEKGLEGTSDKYMGLALLQAGAAMMTTPGGISMALGKGIDVGSKQYAVGMEKINAAKEKFAEARDRLDDLRINRDDMNTKDIRAAEKEVREAQLKGQELFYNGLVSDLGVKQKNVTAIFGAAADDLKTTRQIEAERANTLTRERGASARTQAQLDAPSGVERLVGRMQTDPKFAAAYREYASIGPEIKGDAAILAKYAGPQGEIALKMLEGSGPEGKAQAQLIRQKLAASMLTPVSVANALP